MNLASTVPSAMKTAASAPSQSDPASSDPHLSHIPSAPSVSKLASLEAAAAPPVMGSTEGESQGALFDDRKGVAAKKRGRPKGSSRNNKSAARRADHGKAKARTGARGSQMAMAMSGDTSPTSASPPDSFGAMQSGSVAVLGEAARTHEPELQSFQRDQLVPLDPLASEIASAAQRPPPDGAAPGG